MLQEQNYIIDIATINIKIIKGSRAIVSHTPKNFSTFGRKSFCNFGLFAQGVGVFSTQIKVRGLLAFETTSLVVVIVQTFIFLAISSSLSY
jgi:hypothetical protein